MFASVEYVGNNTIRLLLTHEATNKILNIIEYTTDEMSMYDAMIHLTDTCICNMGSVHAPVYPKCKHIEPADTLGLVENLEIDLEYMIAEKEGE